MARGDDENETTERFLMQIRAQVGNPPSLEENEQKVLHLNAIVDAWREWSVLTYNHNVIGDMLVKENHDLKNKIKDLETKMNAPPPPMMFYNYPGGGGGGGGGQNMHYGRSAQVEVPDQDGHNKTTGDDS